MSKDLTVAVRDYAALDRSVRAYHAASRQPRTWTSYNLAWQRFVNFCSPKDAWKATPEDVARWCVWQAGQGLSVSTISGNLSGLKFYYEQLGKGHSQGRSGVATRDSPTNADLVRRVLRGISRKHGRPPLRKAPLLLDSVEKNDGRSAPKPSGVAQSRHSLPRLGILPASERDLWPQCRSHGRWLGRVR